MICPKCNVENVADNKLCIKCGWNLSEQFIPTSQENINQDIPLSIVLFSIVIFFINKM